MATICARRSPKLRALDDEIKALEAAAPERPSRDKARKRSASATIFADAQGHARFKLSYRIGGVGWRPAYDAALDTAPGAKALSLTRRANLAQRTGEDWSDVALTVSTARVARASDIPDVPPLKIDFWQPEQAEDAAPSGGVAGKSIGRFARAAPKTMAAAPEPAPPPLAPVKAEEAATELQANAYSAEFKVPGRISLASDGAQKSFVLAQAQR